MTIDTNENIRSTVRKFVSTLGAHDQFSDRDDIMATGVIKSVNLMELITAIEDQFELEITQRDVHDGHLRSVDRVVALVEARMASR